jgi:hypothetical protein
MSLGTKPASTAAREAPTKGKKIVIFFQALLFSK